MSRPREYPPCVDRRTFHRWREGFCLHCGIDRESKVSIETKPKLRGTSHFDTHTRGRWQAPDILAISSEWDRISQARDFFRFVQNGEITLEEAEADIRMTEGQRDLLLAHCSENEALRIEAVFQAREQTWEAFMLLCAGEELEEKRNAYIEGFV